MDISPLLAIPLILSPPTIDGRIGPDEWNSAAGTPGFLEASGDLAPHQTTVHAAFDEEHLYLAFVSYNDSGVKGAAKEHDSLALFQDDAFEIYLQPGAEGAPYFLFAGNALETRYDAKGLDGTWDAEWTLACHREYDTYFVAATWTAEVKIPFRSLGLKSAPADGTVWRADFCRDWTAGLAEADLPTKKGSADFGNRAETDVTEV